MKKISLKFILTLLAALIAVPIAFAQTPPPIIPDQEGNTDETLIIPHSTQNAEAGSYFQSTYLPEITRVVIAVAGAAAFLFVIIGGIQILTAYGDEEKITAAKKTITYAIIGLIVSLLSYAIVSIISGIQISAPSPGTQTPGSEDMTQEEMDDPGRYGSGGSRETLTQEQILSGN